MPGKHAPASPRSFYFSVGRVAGGLVAAIVLLTVIVMAATGSTPKDTAVRRPTASATPTITDTPSARATPTHTRTAQQTPVAVLSPVPRNKVTISVLNGTQRPGLAGTVAQKLRADGWTDISFVGNAAPTKTTSTAYRAGAYTYARELHDAHPELGAIQRATDTQPKTMIVITLGADYPG